MQSASFSTWIMGSTALRSPPLHLRQTCDRKAVVNRQRLAGIVLALVAAILAFIFTGFAVALIAAWIVFHEYQHGARGD
jgi:hypothetical protein